MHWLLVVRRGQPSGPPVLAVPGMNKLVRQKVSFQVVRTSITEHVFRGAVVAGFMVFQAVMRRLIAQRQEKRVFAVMASAKEFASLRHQLLQAGDVFVCDLD